MLNKDQRTAIIKDHGRKDSDTASPEVQAALFSARIEYLTEHLKKHKHDYSTRHGLMKLVHKRQRLLNYLKVENHDRYRALLEKLGLRR
jgi:small subunit ribosomal protein S15